MTLLRLACLVLIAALQAAEPATASALLLDLDPAGGAWTAVAEDGHAGGTIPAGWSDNSAWRKSRVDHRRGEVDGIAFWRIDISRAGGASAFFPIPDLERPAIYCLSGRVRGIGIDSASFALQQLDAPWKAAWSQIPPLDGSWQDLDWTWRQEPAPGRHGVYLQIGARAGTLDLASLRLERWSEAGYLAANAPPVGGAKNLLRITRAPAGLPSGWALDRDDSDDEVEIAADPAVTGPGGGPALRLATAKPRAQLWCGATRVPAGAPHVASVWVRGQGSGSLIVPGQKYAILAETRFTVTASDGWKRIQAGFTPPLPTQVLALKLAFTGRLWIDALQLERGTAASDYAPPFPCEIGLRHASPALVQFAPAVALEWAIAGPSTGAQVVATASDGYGREAALPPQPAAATGSLRCDALADRPFGALRIQATVVAADGGALSAPCELVVLRLPTPRHQGEDAPDSFFGVLAPSTRRHALMAKAMGANWVRTHDCNGATLWHNLEAERGRWTWHDGELLRYRAHYLKVLGMLSTAPRWASNVGEGRDGYFDQYYQPQDLEAWQDYVRTITTRYRGVVDAWQVWNEPWGDQFWHTGRDRTRKTWVVGPDPAGDYAWLCVLAQASAKAVDPALRLVGISTAPEDHSLGWTARVRDQGGLAACDVISYHHYANTAATADDQVAQGWRSALAPLLGADGRAPKPVWMTEGNPLVNCDGPGLYRLNQPGAGPEDVAAAGDRCARWLVSLRARGVDKGFLYSLHCHTYVHEQAPYRALVGRDGYLHPAAAAYAACAWQIEDTAPAGISEPAPGVWAFSFQGRGRAVVALAPQPGHAAFAIPAGIAASDLFGNPLAAGSVLGGRMTYLTAAGSAADLLARLR